MVALLEAATATFDVDDPSAVEGVFAVQGISLDVIFTDFIRRKGFIFENMRVALRAQAQCRATLKTLSDFKNPRSKPPSGSQSKNRTSRLLKGRKHRQVQALEQSFARTHLCIEEKATQRLDARAPCAPDRNRPPRQALASFHWSDNRGGQSVLCFERHAPRRPLPRSRARDAAYPPRAPHVRGKH
jgi:hypothetical protein